MCNIVCIILEEILENNRGFLLVEVNDFLQHVKEKFSGVLLPVDIITKQGLIGKGYKETQVYDFCEYNYSVCIVMSVAWVGVL